MSWFACRVDYEMEYDEEGFPPYASATEAGAFEAEDAEGACSVARWALKPYGRLWHSVAWEAVACRDREEAEMTAMRMREWNWGC